MVARGNYILDDNHNPVLVADILEWAKWCETADRHVAHTVIGTYRISTVFLGTDHNFGFDEDKRPVLFETMVFEPCDDTDIGLDYVQAADFEMWRYATWSEAEAGHTRMCELVRAAVQEQNDLGSLLQNVKGL